MITQSINLNLIPGGVLPRINVSQYDQGTRTLVFNLFNGATSFTVTGLTVYIVGTKKDNTGFEYACTISGTSQVTCDITDQMTAFAGEVTCEIRILDGTDQLGTCNFILNVEPSALSDNTVISETDIPIIQNIPQYVSEAEGYKDLAHQWATYGSDSETPSSTNNAKYWANQSQQYATGALQWKGSITFANIPSTGITQGDMYNVTDSFTTDSRFAEGSGIECPAGTNIIYDENGKWDLQNPPYEASQVEYDNTTSGASATDAQGALDEAFSDIDEIYKANSILGAKNLIPYPYYTTSSTILNVSITNNSDGTITLNGTSTGNGEFVFVANANNFYPKAGTYKVSGISGGSSSTYFIETQLSGSVTYLYDGEEEITTDGTKYLRFSFKFKTGATFTDFVVSPMLRLASDTDDTYRPYAMTNRELTEEVNEVKSNLATIETTSTASKAYSVGDYLVYKGQLYEVTSAIASGGTLTVGTNIVATTVGNVLSTINSNLSDLYPVGAIVMGATSDFSTEAKIIARYGGSAWTRIQDKGLFGAGSIISAGATGGSNNAIVPYHRHSVSAFSTTDGNGKHSHGWFTDITAGNLTTSAAATGMTRGLSNYYNFHTDEAGSHNHTIPAHNTDYVGTSGNATNANIQASYGVYIWVRTA